MQKIGINRDVDDFLLFIILLKEYFILYFYTLFPCCEWVFWETYSFKS